MDEDDQERFVELSVGRERGEWGREGGGGALGEDARHVTSRPTALPFY